MEIKADILKILRDSPSIRLLKSRNAEFILAFLNDVFDVQTSIGSEKFHLLLEGRLDESDEVIEDDNQVGKIETNEEKAKRWIKEWTDRGYLTNYQNENGEVVYELSSYTSKALDWVESLKREDYIGTESKFKALFGQLKELVEFTNEDRAKRKEILEKRKLEIEHQIQDLDMGLDVEVFDEYQIVPRYNSLNKMAKELLSDFKEVDDNFKDIIRQIYQRQTDNSVKKEILNYIFDAYGELKNSPQGKSFYSFWEFLLSSDLQHEWDDLTQTLYKTLEMKNIDAHDMFLKDLKQHLFTAGEKVYKTNDRMSEKLSRIIRQNEFSNTEVAKNIINDIKRLLIEASKRKETPDASFEIEDGIALGLPLERQLTFEPTKNSDYKDKPSDARIDVEDLERLEKLYNPYAIDRNVLRRHINNVLSEQSQTTIADVIAGANGVSKGLAEIFGYIGLLKEYHYTVSKDRYQSVEFDATGHKVLEIPEIIITK